MARVPGGTPLPRSPRAAVETLTHYFRYNANLGRLGKPTLQIGCWLRSAHLIAPAVPGYATDYDLSALALLMRDWAGDALLSDSRLVTCLIADNLNDLHPLLVNNPARRPRDDPAADDRRTARRARTPRARSSRRARGVLRQSGQLAAALTGSTLSAVENLLKLKEYRREPIRPADLVGLEERTRRARGRRADRVRRAAPHAGRFPRARRDEGLAARGHRALARGRPGRLADGLSHLRPGRHGQDVSRRMSGGRGGHSRWSRSRTSATSGSAARRATWKKSSASCTGWTVATCSSTRPTRRSAARRGRQRRRTWRARVLHVCQGNEQAGQSRAHRLGAGVEPAGFDRGRSQAARPRGREAAAVSRPRRRRKVSACCARFAGSAASTLTDADLGGQPRAAADPADARRGGGAGAENLPHDEDAPGCRRRGAGGRAGGLPESGARWRRCVSRSALAARGGERPEFRAGGVSRGNGQP